MQILIVLIQHQYYLHVGLIHKSSSVNLLANLLSITTLAWSADNDMSLVTTKIETHCLQCAQVLLLKNTCAPRRQTNWTRKGKIPSRTKVNDENFGCIYVDISQYASL